MTNAPKILDNKFKIGEKVWALANFSGWNTKIEVCPVFIVEITQGCGLGLEYRVHIHPHNPKLVTVDEEDLSKAKEELNDKYDRMRKEADDE